MTKLILNLLAKVLLVSIACGTVAVLIWYFFTARTMDSMSLILFWCSASLIAIGVLLFGGHSDKSLAPRDFRSAGAIDPKDMAYGRNLRYLSESVLIVIILAGGVVMAVSLILTDFQ